MNIYSYKYIFLFILHLAILLWHFDIESVFMVLLNDTFWNIAHLNLCEEISAMKIWHAEILHFSLTFYHYFWKKKCFEIRNSNLSLFCKLHQTNIHKNKCNHLYQSTLRIFILWSWLYRRILLGLYFPLKDWNQKCSNWI